MISSKVKLAIVCGRPSSRISKSAAVKPRTTAPDLSRTMTSTETTLRFERNTGRCCAPGPDAVDERARRGDDGARRIGVSDATEVTAQYRNLTLSVIERIGRTERTWPKVGELTTVSMPA